MRKLLSIFFIVMLTPACLMANCALDTNLTGCVSYNGCFFVPASGMLDPECRPCESGTYNSDSLETTDYCTTCPTSYGVSGKIPNPDAYDNGQSECPWMCDANYYKSGNTCEICPTGATSPAGSTAPTQCQCEQNKYLTQNNGEYICKSCPTHSFNYASGSTSITDCQCEAQYYMGDANDNQCISCPEHGNCAYAGRTYLTATCASGYQKNIDTTNHTFTCDNCSDSNATFDGTICKCNANYYGEPNGLNTTCTACPAGTTGAAGATAKSACHMTQNTKFCDANGKCMKLLQNATNINQ